MSDKMNGTAHLESDNEDKRSLSNSINASVSSDAGPSKEKIKVTPPTSNGDEAAVKVEETDEEASGEESLANLGNSFGGEEIVLPTEQVHEKIISVTDSNGQLMFLFKWKGSADGELVSDSDANSQFDPQFVIQFYEASHQFIN